MARIDSVTKGAGDAWDDAVLHRRAIRDGTEVPKGVIAPEEYVGRLVGAEDNEEDRAQNWGKRLGAGKFLEHEALLKQLGITPDYGE